MILNILLNIITGFLNLLLFPLEAINIGVDFLVGISAIKNFFKIVAFILPWSNILPLIILTISLFVFRIIISIIKTIWELIPIL